MQSKKQLILWVLNILDNESDAQHPLTQTEIARILSDVYPCDRKTVCRNIGFLRKMGYPIRKTAKGFYMDSVFAKEELDFVRAALLAAEGKTEEEKEALCLRVVAVLSKARRK